ncbi:MAG: O-antigen ligase family protein [Coriobacteriia bacterium]
MQRRYELPVLVLGAMFALVPVVSGNLTFLGIGSQSLTYDPIALPRFVLAAALASAGWLLWWLGARTKPPVLRLDPVWGVLAALGAWAAVSTALSPHRALALLGQSERLEGLVTVLMYGILYGLGLQAVRRVADARAVLSALGAGAALMAAYGLLQFTGIDPAGYALEGFAFDTRRAFGTLGNPNFLGGLLVLALPVLAALAVSSAGPRARVAWWAATLIAGGAVIATFTRAAWLVAILEVGIMVLAWRRSGGGARPERKPMALIAAATTVVALTVAISMTTTGETNIIERIEDAFMAGGGASERTLAIGIAAEAVRERPLLGYGPDAFLPAMRLHRTDAYVALFGENRIVNNAHSWPVQYAVTLGVPGAFLLVAALGLALWRGRALVRVTDAAPAGSVLMSGAWIGCLGYCGFMLTNVAVPGSVLPLWAVLGVLGRPGARPVTLPAFARPASAALSGLALAVAVFGGAALLAADATYLAARDAYHEQRFEESARLAGKASELNPLSVKYARGEAQALAQLVPSAIMGGTSAVRVRELYDSADAAFSEARTMSPRDYPAAAWQAALRARAGAHLRDDELLRLAGQAATEAAALDRQHAAVGALVSGDTSDAAAMRAAAVPALP